MVPTFFFFYGITKYLKQGGEGGVRLVLMHSGQMNICCCFWDVVPRFFFFYGITKYLNLAKRTFFVVPASVRLVLGASKLWGSWEQTHRQAWRFFPGARLVQWELYPFTLVQVIGAGSPYPHRASQRYAGIVALLAWSDGGWVVCLCLLWAYVT